MSSGKTIYQLIEELGVNKELVGFWTKLHEELIRQLKRDHSPLTTDISLVVETTYPVLEEAAAITKQLIEEASEAVDILDKHKFLNPLDVDGSEDEEDSAEQPTESPE
jgi:transposase-like protein